MSNLAHLQFEVAHGDARAVLQALHKFRDLQSKLSSSVQGSLSDAVDSVLNTLYTIKLELWVPTYQLITVLHALREAGYVDLHLKLAHPSPSIGSKEGVVQEVLRSVRMEEEDEDEEVTPVAATIQSPATPETTTPTSTTPLPSPVATTHTLPHNSAPVMSRNEEEAEEEEEEPQPRRSGRKRKPDVDYLEPVIKSPRGRRSSFKRSKQSADQSEEEDEEGEEDEEDEVDEVLKKSSEEKIEHDMRRGGRPMTRLVVAERTAAADTFWKANRFMELLLASPLIDFQGPVAQSWIATFLRFSRGDEAETSSSSPICLLTKLCHLEDETEDVMNFSHMMRRVQLAMMHKMHPWGTDVYQTQIFPYLEPEEQNVITRAVYRTMKEEGVKTASLLAALSTYGGLLISAAKIRHLIRDMNPPAMSSLCEMLRQPSTAGGVFKERICTLLIPAVAYLREQIPMTLGDMFPSKFLADMHISADLQCGDLTQTDTFYSSIPTNAFSLLARSSDWDSCLTLPAGSGESVSLAGLIQDFSFSNITLNPPPSPRAAAALALKSAVTCNLLPRSHSSILNHKPYFPCANHPEFVAVKTYFNLRSRLLKSVPYPTGSDDDASIERIQWTDEERQLAKLAKPVQHIEVLSQELSKLYDRNTGLRKNNKDYLRIEPAVFDEKEILLLDKHGDTMVYMNGNLPSAVHSNTLNIIKNVMVNYHPNSVMRSVDTKEVTTPRFSAIHFTCTYARYGKKGHKAPENVHPANLVLETASGGIRSLNRGQLAPYPARELLDNQEEFDVLKKCFDPLFRALETKLQNHLPDDTETISFTVESTPFLESSPAYPFHGFVLNINVRTNVHRDPKDLHLCLVLPFGEFTGGELGLVELGLVVALRSGDFIIFPSTKISHYNLDYSGERGSLVLHTDSSSTVWTPENGFAGWIDVVNADK